MRGSTLFIATSGIFLGASLAAYLIERRFSRPDATSAEQADAQLAEIRQRDYDVRLERSQGEQVVRIALPPTTVERLRQSLEASNRQPSVTLPSAEKSQLMSDSVSMERKVTLSLQNKSTYKKVGEDLYKSVQPVTQSNLARCSNDQIPLATIAFPPDLDPTAHNLIVEVTFWRTEKTKMATIGSAVFSYSIHFPMSGHAGVTPPVELAGK